MIDASQKKDLYLLWTFAKTDFKLRYHGSVLGYFWSLLKPLLIFLVLNFVFQHVFAAEVEHYSLFLLTGIVLWNFFSEGTKVGLNSLMSKAAILTKLNIPKWVVVLSSTLNILMTFLINLVILSLFFIFSGIYPSISGVFIFVVISLLIYLMIVGFSFVCAPLYVKFRDLNQIWDILLLAGFYSAPVIYPVDIIPEGYRFFVYMNPMTWFLVNGKSALISSELPNLNELFLVLAGLFVLLIGSFFVFKKQSRRIVELI